MENLLYLGVPILKHITVTRIPWNAESSLSALCHKTELNAKTPQKFTLQPPLMTSESSAYVLILRVTGGTKVLSPIPIGAFLKEILLLTSKDFFPTRKSPITEDLCYQGEQTGGHKYCFFL